MKRIIFLAALVLVTTGCTQSQVLRYIDAVMQGHKETADAAVHEYEAIKADAIAGLPCEEWYDTAMSVGWTPDQWHTVARTMRGESMCDPNAHNPSGATGLMQVMPMWIDDCGGGDLRDPEFNLACALHILDVSSWAAWSAHQPGY